MIDDEGWEWLKVGRRLTRFGLGLKTLLTNSNTGVKLDDGCAEGGGDWKAVTPPVLCLSSTDSKI